MQLRRGWEEHPVIKFKQNLIEDNGHGLNQELYYEVDY